MDTLSNLYKAGRLVRLLGWITFIAAIGVIAAIIIPYMYSNELPEELYIFLLLLISSIALSTFTLFTGNAIKHNKKWAKVSGLILALLALFSPPIGTVLGIFILYYLYKGWSESESNT